MIFMDLRVVGTFHHLIIGWRIHLPGRKVAAADDPEVNLEAGQPPKNEKAVGALMMRNSVAAVEVDRTVGAKARAKVEVRAGLDRGSGALQGRGQSWTLKRL
mgnify:CR=1 FL=1